VGTGALPVINTTNSNAAAPTYHLNNGYPVLVRSGNTPGVATPSAYYHGIAGGDNRQHPFWRSEVLQRVMNLTTVRTHQYAVWITIGFFEVKREGDIGMLLGGQPWLAYDTFGPEKGALDGSNARYRAFFLVDRLRLTGFDPGNAGIYRPAIVYRNRIK